MENQINEETADSLRCRIVIEAANGPTSRKAMRYSPGEGSAVVPDILCNAGGVVVSYLEWVQNQQAIYWGGDGDKLQTETRYGPFLRGSM